MIDKTSHVPTLFDTSVFTDHTRLTERYVAPPFSVLDKRAGYWQARRAQWMELGFRSEVGREDKLTYGTDGLTQRNGHPFFVDDVHTSVFDPVICEIVYRWWSPAGGRVLDPFAGGSVRGIVAGVLGRPYVGADIRMEQIEANEEQAENLTGVLSVVPEWLLCDSTTGSPDGPFDLIFTCPPYGDLERYSDDPADLSNRDWSAFRSDYTTAIELAVGQLDRDRFAAIVVGNFRDRRGVFRDLVGATVEAFTAAGADLYADCVIVQRAGTAGPRASANFPETRRPVRLHETLLVFTKGDPKTAAAAVAHEKEVMT